jgi:hypothetical protein
MPSTPLPKLALPILILIWFCFCGVVIDPATGANEPENVVGSEKGRNKGAGDGDDFKGW